MNPTLSIIILNFNRKKDSLELLKSLSLQTYQPFEIILVDNASIDGSVAAITKKFPKVRILHLLRNIGRPAHNAGADIAAGDVLVFLDADLYFTDRDFLKKLAARFKKKSIDAVSFYMKDPTGRTYGWEPNYFKKGNSRDGFESTFGGGMWAIRRKIFTEVGGFNPGFFVYVDEWEYLIRLWEKGYKVSYFPGLLIGFHKESPYAYRSIMKGYHVIINHAQIYALFLPVRVWLKFLKHHTGQTASVLKSGEANRWGIVKGLLLAFFFFCKALPQRKVIKGATLKKFLRFYFPEKGDVVVAKWGWE